MRRRHDLFTLDLFDIPRPPAATEGALNCAVEICHTLSEALKASPQTRYQVAARMSELVGHEISKYSLDSWTAESREGHRFPLEYAPAFEAALESYCLQELLARKRGCRVLKGEEALLAELGSIGQMKAELARQEKAIKDYLKEKR
ncbi:MAG: hypothetical protein HYU77_13655 [Betaproteobacteria bacterium]|nr:hypothetical protein [Betaproteobacteria bacterium]